MRSKILVVAGIFVLSIAGCSAAPAEDATPSSPEESNAAPASSPVAWETCEHPSGLVISYPEGWRVVPDASLPACSGFNPISADNPAPEVIDAAVLVSVETVDFAAVVDPDATSGETLNRELASVDGHDAVRIESRSEGNELLPGNLRSTRWFVVFGRDQTLSLVTYESGDPGEYESVRGTLDEMVTRLELPEDN